MQWRPIRPETAGERSIGENQGWKKPRFFGFFYRFLGFLGYLGFFRFLGFLGFNVHNAEHRYIIYDPRQVAYMKISVC